MAQQDITSPLQFGGGYVKRFDASLGLNSSFSSVNLDLVVDTDGVAGTVQSFQENSLLPGSISGFFAGAFNFVGVVQSWEESFSEAGKTHRVRLVDPRVIFGDVVIMTNGSLVKLPNSEFLGVGSGVPNVINAYSYYSNDATSQRTEDGMPWNKIKAALEATGFVTVYDKRFALSFSTGFLAPEYFRINADEISLETLLQTVSAGLGLDYYATISTGYNPASGYNWINIVAVPRETSATGTTISDLITNKRASGILKSYVKGKELRSGPTDVLVIGENRKFVQTIQDTYPCYGRTSEGVLLTAAGNSTTFGASFQPLDDPQRHNGWVILDNVVNDKITNRNLIPLINATGNATYISTPGYPMTVFQGEQNKSVLGYRPTENVMRAAAFSRESWETVLFVEQPTVAAAIGINSVPIRETGTLINNIGFARDSAGGIKTTLFKMGSELRRTEDQEIIIDYVYEATKRVSDTYYGKQFLVELPVGEILVTNSVAGATLNFRGGYRVIDAAWNDNAPTVVKQSNNTNFRNDDGLVKGYATLSNARDNLVPSVVITNPNGNLIGSTGFLRYNLGSYDINKYLIDGTSLHFSVKFEQDNSNKARAIMSLDDPVEYKGFGTLDLTGKTPEYHGTGYIVPTGYVPSGIYVAATSGVPVSYWEFWRIFGLTDLQIFELGKYYQTNKELGLAPQRVTYFNAVQVPMENVLQQYGPFLAQGDRHGGTQLIRDNSLAPWTYGSTSILNAAGVDTASGALMNKTVIDTAQLVCAGLPEHNLGELLGDNANITSLSITFGQEGLITNYGLQTFISPFVRISQALNHKMAKNSVLTNKIQKDVQKLRNKLEGIESKNGYYEVSNSRDTWNDPLRGAEKFDKPPRLGYRFDGLGDHNPYGGGTAYA